MSDCEMCDGLQWTGTAETAERCECYDKKGIRI